MVKLLLKSGADASELSSNGHTALEYAKLTQRKVAQYATTRTTEFEYLDSDSMAMLIC
jgi:ankyrin repeat protein